MKHSRELYSSDKVLRSFTVICPAERSDYAQTSRQKTESLVNAFSSTTHCLCITRYRHILPVNSRRYSQSPRIVSFLFSRCSQRYFPVNSRRGSHESAPGAFARKLYAEREIRRARHRAKPDDVPSSQFLLHSGGVKPTRPRGRNENI